MKEAVIWAWYAFDQPRIGKSANHKRDMISMKWGRSVVCGTEETCKLSNYEKKKREGRITIRNRKTSSRSRWGGTLGCGDMRLLLFLPSIACIWAWEHWCHCLKLRPLVLKAKQEFKAPNAVPIQFSMVIPESRFSTNYTFVHCSASAF